MKPFASYLSVGAIVVAGVAVDRFAFNAPIGTVHALNAPSREARPLHAAGAPVAADDVTINAFNRASPSVVQIINVSIGSGSGVVYDKSGDIVTNFHVVSGGKTFHVRLKSGQTLTATLVGSDSADDLALLHVASANLPVAAFGNSNNLKTGQGVLAIGNPLGLQQTVTNGLVSATGRTVQEPTGAYLPDAIQTSAPINPGNSGGALVALDGTIVGIPTLVAADPQLGSPAEGIGFAISSARVQVVVPQLIKYHRVLHTGRAYLGVTLCSAQTACPPGTPPPSNGVLVTQLVSAGPGAKAGLKTGDVITAIGSKSVSSGDDVISYLANQHPGSRITLTVLRNGQTLHIPVQLGELPSQ